MGKINNEGLENSNDKEVKEVKDTIYDEGFISKLLSFKDIEDVKKLFSDNGIEIDDDNLKLIGQYLKNIVQSVNKRGCLNDNELASVSGGVNVVVKTVGKVVSFPFALGGYVIGATVAGFPKGVYDGFKDTWYDK